MLDALADEVISSVDVLCLRVMFRIFGKGFGALVVNMEKNWGPRAKV